MQGLLAICQDLQKDAETLGILHKSLNEAQNKTFEVVLGHSVTDGFSMNLFVFIEQCEITTRSSSLFTV